MKNTLFTIGFTQKSAKEFFNILQVNKIQLIADVRLNNRGQLAGFTKEKDLIFFLSLFNIDYAHWKDFAPTRELRKKFHSDGNFSEYKKGYLSLLDRRMALAKLDSTILSNRRICLLCSEPKPDRCHRRIAAEIIASSFKSMEILHL